MTERHITVPLVLLADLFALIVIVSLSDWVELHGRDGQ